MSLDTIEDTDVATFYRAQNITLNYIIQTHSLAKLGILVGNGLNEKDNEQYYEAMRLIAKNMEFQY